MTTTLRDVLTARIVFPKFSERLGCEPEALGVVRLLEFCDFIPLAPGDLVSVNDEGVVTDVLELADGWLVEAHLHMTVDPGLVLHLADQWRQESGAPVQVGQAENSPEQGALFRSIRVLSTDREWLDRLAQDPTVEFCETHREPGMPIVFDPSSDDWTS